ncbi:TetR/AcrR family transcriptional regulator C-terminal domain-containing protein [Streptomyces diastaticus]|uniref:Regulatory protein TetR n=2 Tax=Streptomyces TaxID=1883 RepID=A0A380P6L9_STRGR|nr:MULTISPECIES: TetR/AcrR family transcriptional regulator C-terminal domain-containing protein [Streptomyces]NEE26554.1 TetR/AcrR family transcriptional regulator [Streptomyces sp. SID7982]NEE50361.1 TetR/AcrR family transcriptional regulator [Streptomyces sp. SID8455]WSU34562.1 TetR/AcrR family transcriptional regulator [Streptomyces gougerotii]QNE84315.1 TetR family transcriptional regulator [Streptomyces rutgersensis]SUP60548.1 Regulatory protein TetR [Streptomyces griseus]
MSIIAGQGDAARSLKLLWGAAGGERRSPGPKPALTVEAVVAAAVEVADEGGLAALSMRAVAERLGRSSMALYTYVPGKAELVDLMYDRAHAELPGSYPLDEGWRAAATAWAADLRALYLRHPWLLQVSYARPVLGPCEQGVLEALAGILFATGLPADTLRAAASSLFDLVRGAARTRAEARLATATTGVADAEWWAERSARLGEVAPDFAARFPLSVRLSAEDAGGGAPASWEERMDATHAAGLALLLDGVEAAAGAPPGGVSPR